MTMLVRLSGAAVAAVCAVGMFCHSASVVAPSIGESIPDSVAAEFRGGLCTTYAPATCPAGACATGGYVGPGIFPGSPTGNINCGASCGSYFSTVTACPG